MSEIVYRPLLAAELDRLGEIDRTEYIPCLLYTSDAADERSSVDLGGRRIIKKKKKQHLDKSQRLHKNEDKQHT